MYETAAPSAGHSPVREETAHSRARRPVPAWVGRTAARAALGLPLVAAAVPMALLGAGARAAQAQRAVIRRFGPGGMSEPAARTGAGRVLRHSAVVFLPALLSFALVALSAFGVLSGYLYGFRPDGSYAALAHPFTPDHAFDNSWGGPSLIGAWSVHALVALGVHVVSLTVIRGLTGLQDRVTRSMLGS